MDYRRLGRTGLEVSALALGTVELGLEYGIALPGESGRPPEDEAARMVHAAIDGGITLIDTARAYGESEAVLGRILGKRRSEVVLATKVRTQRADGTTPTGAELRSLMEESLDTSLGLLQTDYVDIWQIHNVDGPLLEQRDVVGEVFDNVRQSGKVRSVGGSTYGTDYPMQALQSGLFDMLQVTYSVLDQRLADEVLPAAAAQDVGIIVRSILLKGALTTRGDYLPEHLAALRQRSQEFRRLVAAAGADITPVQAAIAFGLAHPHIQSVLVGVRSAEELEEALTATAVHLELDLLRQLAGLRLDDPDLLNPSTWGIP